MGKILEEIKDVEGLLNDKEAETLYNLSRNCKGKGVIVEIGSWKGKSTICLAKGVGKKKIKVFAVDPHDVTFNIEGEGDLPSWTRNTYKDKLKLKGVKKSSSLKDFERNIEKANVRDIVKKVVKTSREAANLINEPIELIFIDGDHGYEGVKEDFDIWFPKVIPGGIMAFHDTIWGDPRRLMIEKVFKGNDFRNIRFANSITYAQKVIKNNYIDRVKNRQNLLLSTVYSFIYSVSFKLAKYLPKEIKSKLKKKFLSLH